MIANPPVGLWVLPAHVGSNRSALAALQRDFAVICTLEHPHIGRLLELTRDGERYVVTGERLDGWPLREVLARLLPQHLDVSEADEVIRAIGSALAYAHQRGIAHGDVRAENVVVTMDRRFVLTNFLARRTAQVAAEPPRPTDDVRGLARLAAELYTGGASAQDREGTVHEIVPLARLKAIRDVLARPAHQRGGSVAEFLTAAGVAAAGAGATPRGASRSWSVWKGSRSTWRVVLPVVLIIAVGTLAAAFQSAGYDWRESALVLQQRGLDALRVVMAEPPPPQSSQAATLDDATPSPDAAVATSAPLPSDAVEPPTGSVATPQPAVASPPEAVAPPAVTLVSTPPPASDPSVLSFGVARVAAREDHSVVALDVVRSGDATQEAAVGWWTVPDTAHAEDDYANSGRQTVTFPAGATVERLLIPIVNDGVRESDEVFTVHLSRPRGGVTGPVTAARITLHDDD